VIALSAGQFNFTFIKSRYVNLTHNPMITHDPKASVFVDYVVKNVYNVSAIGHFAHKSSLSLTFIKVKGFGDMSKL
jgi:hypothetical protein